MIDAPSVDNRLDQSDQWDHVAFVRKFWSDCVSVNLDQSDQRRRSTLAGPTGPSAPPRSLTGKAEHFQAGPPGPAGPAASASSAGAGVSPAGSSGCDRATGTPRGSTPRSPRSPPSCATWRERPSACTGVPIAGVLDEVGGGARTRDLYRSDGRLRSGKGGRRGRDAHIGVPGRKMQIRAGPPEASGPAPTRQGDDR